MVAILFPPSEAVPLVKVMGYVDRKRYPWIYRNPEYHEKDSNIFADIYINNRIYWRMYTFLWIRQIC